MILSVITPTPQAEDGRSVTQSGLGHDTVYAWQHSSPVCAKLETGAIRITSPLNIDAGMV